MSRYCWRLHPVVEQKSAVHTKLSFNINDDVYIRPKAVKELGISGRVVGFSKQPSAESAISAHQRSKSKKRRLVEDVRLSVQQHSFNLSDVTLKEGVRPSRLFPVYDVCNDGDLNQQTLIVVTSDTTNYRQLATSHLRRTDKVLEIGCSTGECTALMLRRLVLFHMHQQRLGIQETGNGKGGDTSTLQGRIVAFDVGSDVLDQAKMRLQSELDSLNSTDLTDTAGKMYSQLVAIHKVDAIADPKGAYANAMMDRKPDIILIDIGGNRELKGVVSMVHWVQSAFQNDPPRLVIVKSETLAEEYSKARDKHDGDKIPKLSNESALSDKSIQREDVTGNGDQEWFLSLVPSLVRLNDNTGEQSLIPMQTVPKYSHPAQAPMALSPKDNSTPICRFHNYHPDGCIRRTGSRKCPYDHDHCHWCKQIGHVAFNCKHV